MSPKAAIAPAVKKPISILSYSHNATLAFRSFSKEDFLYMMSDMTIEDINRDLQRFKDLEEYEICRKIAYVIKIKIRTEQITF